nr:MAG TPA: hypothetical protein [Caudoviricetes sp.]
MRGRRGITPTFQPYYITSKATICQLLQFVYTMCIHTLQEDHRWSDAASGLTDYGVGGGVGGWKSP